MSVDARSLDVVLGPGEGDTPESRARGSKRLFVRSIDQLAEASDTATGRVLTAHEALDAYGWDVLAKVAEDGAALLSHSPGAAGRLLRARRDLLGLESRLVAAAARVSQAVVADVEASKRVSIRDAERIARVIGLDERLVSWLPKAAPGNEDLAVRLRVVGDDLPRMTATAVAGIAEAAWVASTQRRLERALGIQPPDVPIKHSPNFGGSGYPAYKHGYWLAYDTRQKLGLGEYELPCSLRELAEDRLGIPVIQAELGSSIAGATVEAGADRAIVLNLEGRNRNVFMRRTTLAHELGHLLHDPPRSLHRLRVDDYSDLERPPHQLADVVEQRANAFSVEFIAPQKAVVETFSDPSSAADPIGAVMDRFGVSFTVARYQVKNGLDHDVPLESLTTEAGRRPDQRWEALEAYTVDYHPIENLRPSRSGRFSAVVLRAAIENVISWDSAVEMLEASSVEEVKKAEPWLEDLYPAVFSLS